MNNSSKMPSSEQTPPTFFDSAQEILFENRTAYRQAFSRATGCVKPLVARPIGEPGGHYSVAPIAHEGISMNLGGHDFTVSKEIIDPRKVVAKVDYPLDLYARREWLGYVEYAGKKCLLELGYQIGGDAVEERVPTDPNVFCALSFFHGERPQRLVFKFRPEGQINIVAFSDYYNDGSSFYDKMEVRPGNFVRLQLGRRDRGEHIKSDVFQMQRTHGVSLQDGKYDLWVDNQHSLFEQNFSMTESGLYVMKVRFNEPRSLFDGTTTWAISPTGGSIVSETGKTAWQISTQNLSVLTDKPVWNGHVHTHAGGGHDLAEESFNAMLDYLQEVEPYIFLQSDGSTEVVSIG